MVRYLFGKLEAVSCSVSHSVSAYDTARQHCFTMELQLRQLAIGRVPFYVLVNLKEILEIAEEKKIAIGMFNATGFDSLQAVIAAAEELNQPVIIAHAEVHNVYNDIDLVGPAMIALCSPIKAAAAHRKSAIAFL